MPVDLVAILARQVEKLLGRFHSLGGGDDNGLGKEIEPSFPIAGQTDIVEQLIVILTVGLEVEAEVEHRLPQHLLLAQEQSDQQTPQTAVAVQERVDRLELHMCQRRLEQHRSRLWLVMQEEFQLAHALQQFFCRRRNEGRVARPGFLRPSSGCAETPSGSDCCPGPWSAVSHGSHGIAAATEAARLQAGAGHGRERRRNC